MFEAAAAFEGAAQRLHGRVVSGLASGEVAKQM